MNKTAIYGVHGGGSINFAVVNSAADAAALKTKYPYIYLLQLEGGHCYYAVFENTAEYPQSGIDKPFIDGATDNCGANTGGGCYYLSFDFGHLLHQVGTGQLIAGNVIPGFTK